MNGLTDIKTTGIIEVWKFSEKENEFIHQSSYSFSSRKQRIKKMDYINSILKAIENRSIFKILIKLK